MDQALYNANTDKVYVDQIKDLVIENEKFRTE